MGPSPSIPGHHGHGRERARVRDVPKYQTQITTLSGREEEEARGAESGAWTGVSSVRSLGRGGSPMGAEAAQMSHCCPGAALLGAAHLHLRFIM